MPDYKKMYSIVCGAASDAITDIYRGQEEQAAYDLKEAIRQAERLYAEGNPSFLSRAWRVVKQLIPILIGCLVIAVALFCIFLYGAFFAMQNGLV